ncbi:GNAT family N-acetyltransferase [Bacillus sp. KH172YL63]|uniref:GNAT family N-acetyltransferase n=1 Tax=Bacillus sp. KH172YL63 TaxID=2709784 RepID=UPI0013E48CD0|nr:N-acetyltransferase [Bacillus sp. KH172YL63]BCB02950.1 hypothetical protein KH172YL63_10830 [Bacillus sp. KH172YL63]
MSQQCASLQSPIDLGEGLTLVYQNPKAFSRYYAIYYAQKYADYFFKSSPEASIEIATAFDCGYLIVKDGMPIGGVFLKPNFMADFFLVPPFEDYEGLLHKLLRHVRKISKAEEKIFLREIVEEHVLAYKEKGCRIHEVNYWMIRPTESLKVTLPEGYRSRSVSYDDIHGIASLLLKSYKANPAYKNIGTKEAYADHVMEFIEKYQHNHTMDQCSRVIIDQRNGAIVGVCLHMEFEGYPLIMSLAVDPDHQRNGLGRYLLTHSINASSKKYPATRLSVIKDNAAIKLYEDLGFIRNRSLTDMYVV